MCSVLPITGLAALLLVARPLQKPFTPQPQFDPPSIVSSAEAVYPLHSVAWGTVVLELTLDESGTVTNIRVVHGIPSLTEPAERSIKEWKFRPAQFEGKSVPSKVPVAFSFVPPNVGPRYRSQENKRQKRETGPEITAEGEAADDLFGHAFSRGS